MSGDRSALIRYAAIASIAAATAFYVFGPSLILDDGFQSTQKHTAVGLANPGNDCYINSVLQALAASKTFRRYLQEHQELKRGRWSLENDSNDSAHDDELAESEELSDLHRNSLTHALSDILERLNDPRLKGMTISNRGFVRALEHAFAAKLSRRQQDAQELLQFVVEKLDEEAKARITASAGSDTKTASAQLPNQGRLESQIECSYCHYRPSANVSNFLVLSLNVPHHANTSIDSCFDGLLKQEIIEDYACAKCKSAFVVAQRESRIAALGDKAREDVMTGVRKLQRELLDNPELALEDENLRSGPTPKRQITKHNRISAYPEVLFVHLSRSLFGSQSSKNTAKVSFGEHLTLGTLQRHKYRLVCVVTHRGSHNSGHYETFRRQDVPIPAPGEVENETRGQGALADAERLRRKRRGQHHWWGISDDKDRECHTQDVLALQRECYMLFYEKVGGDHRWEGSAAPASWSD